LETSHVLMVNDVECVTWGHGFSDAAVCHEFYGSMARVTRALSKLEMKDGVVCVMGSLRATG